MKSNMGEAVWGRGEADEQSVVGEVGMEGERERGATRGLQGAASPFTFFFSLPNLKGDQH